MTDLIDQIVFDSFSASIDIILKGRNAQIYPKRNDRSHHVNEFLSNSDFCVQVLSSSWRQDISIPMFIDISLILSKSKKVLIERWKFVYQRQNDYFQSDRSKPVIKTKLFQKRLITFLRTLYSFIRLLPGYQVLKLLPVVPNLVFEISDLENPPITPSQLASDIWKVYDFPSMPSSRGILEVGVCYVENSVLQRVLNLKEDISGFSAVTPESRIGAGSRGMSFASTPIPIPINQQATPYRGDLTSNDVRVRQPSTSPAFASGSRGSFGTSPLDTRPRSYSTGEKYSYSNTKVQRRLSLDSRLQQSSGASALGDILNIDNIYNMLHLGEKSSVSTTASGSRKKARERERKSLDNKPILHTAISDNLSRDLRSFAVDSNREEQYMNNGTEIDKSVLFDASVTINESYPEYSDQPTDALVPVSFQSSDSTEYACNKSLPSSPFKTLIRHFEHQLPATELSDDASKLKHVLATLPLINGSHTVSDSNYLTALLGAANTNAFVLAISGAPELSTKSALSDSTEIAFPFGGEGDLVIENRADSTSDATAENKNSGQQPSFTSQDSVRQESNLDIIGNQPGNKSNYTGGNSTNSVAPYTQLVIAPQIESFVRHVEAFTSSVNQSLIDSSQEEDSLQHLSTQLNEFRQFRASVNQVRSI